MRWAIARAMYRFGLPYWWVTPRWTQAELDVIREQARQRYERMRENFE